MTITITNPRRETAEQPVNWVQFEELFIGIYEEVDPQGEVRYTIARGECETTMKYAPRDEFAACSSRERTISGSCRVASLSLAVVPEATEHIRRAFVDHGVRPRDPGRVVDVLEEMIWMWMDGTTTHEEVQSIYNKLKALDATDVEWLR